MWLITWNVLSSLTIEGLNPTPVIVWQPVSIRVDVLVSGEHQCSSVPGVIQAQSVAKLVGRHKQQIHTSTQQLQWISQTYKYIFYLQYICFIVQVFIFTSDQTACFVTETFFIKLQLTIEKIVLII